MKCTFSRDYPRVQTVSVPGRCLKTEAHFRPFSLNTHAII